MWRIDAATGQSALVPVPEALLPRTVEHATPLARMLSRMEELYAPTMREVIVPQRRLEAADRAFLAFFAAAMLARTDEERDNWQGEWQQILEQMQRKERIRQSIASPALIQGWATTMSGDSASFTMQHGKPFATPNVHRMLPPTMRGVGRLLSSMSMTVLVSSGAVFIASDRPCVMCGIDLASPQTQVHLPLSPDRLLTFSWQPDLDGHYVVVAKEGVASANEITQSHAERWVIASAV